MFGVGAPPGGVTRVDNMTSTIEESPLWRRTFADSLADPGVSRLVNSLRNARERVAQLTSRIVVSLPGLTLHDSSHLDALWDVASTIAGDDYTLNPLEGYLFGTAVLLHDAALCHEAYSGGQQAVRATTQWKDAHSRRLMNHGSVDLNDVDFEALRNLHATQAATLAIQCWDSGEGDPWYIIDDADLRNQYGPLIGQIASSHHWDIEDVTEKFSVPRPPAHFLRSQWSADPMTLASLLRVSDAGHMDSSRAPSFLLKILQMNLVSREHWKAQNHLGRLTYKHDDPTQLVVASTAPFLHAEASAWWVAFDLVDQFDRELKQCDAILRTAGGASRRPFRCTGVAGAGNPKELAKYIETRGWTPTNSTVHVSDVAALVGRLGGEQLYGTGADRLAIALRELLQNAADAIAARRLIGESAFNGHIRIRLSRNHDNSRQVLQVDDDGVGMSPQTLSRDLLDFGKSFWTSERASSEFPGIHAAKHSPIGRFGIGFFSIFMAAAKAKVFSRRFDRALQDVRCLSFDNGLSLRPVLSDQRPQDFGMDVSTRVILELKPDAGVDPTRIRIPCNVSGQQAFHVAFNHYVTALVSGIEAAISVEVDGVASKVHDGFPPSEKHRGRWLRSLSYVPAGVNAPAERLADSLSSRLREIRDGDCCYGLAALRVEQAAPHDYLSGKAVGGFVTHDFHGPFVGLIDHFPNSAKREPGEIAAPRHAVDAWLAEQVALLDGRLDPLHGMLASYSLCAFDYDPIDVLKRLLVITSSGIDSWRLSELAKLLRRGNRLAFRVSSYGDAMMLEQHGEQQTIAGVATCYVVSSGKFNKADMAQDIPKQSKSLVGVVHRTLVNQGAQPTWTIQPKLYRGPFGRCDCLEVRI